MPSVRLWPQLLMFSACLVHVIRSEVRANNFDLADPSRTLDESQKRSGFLPMRGRKWIEGATHQSGIHNRLNLIRAYLDSLTDLNQPSEHISNDLLSEPSSSDLSSGTGRSKKRLEPSLVGNGRLDQMPTNLYAYSYPLSAWFNQFLSSSSIGNSPKRAGFLPMRGRKSDPSVNNVDGGSSADEPAAELSFLYPFENSMQPGQEKRAGFMPMRGKKVLEPSVKRAFHALRG